MEGAENMKEIWRPIPGFEATHEASSLGQVRSLDREIRIGKTRRMIGGVLRPSRMGSNPYLCVDLCVDGQHYRRPVHRFVALAFLGGAPAGKPHVAHYDGNKDNNHVTNLRWASQKENEADKRRHGRTLNGERVSGSKLTAEKVRPIRDSNKSLSALAREYCVSKQAISAVRNNRTWRQIGPETRDGMRVWRGLK